MLPYEYYRIRRMTVDDISSVTEIENLSFSHPWTSAAFEGELNNYPISHPYVIEFIPKKRVIGHLIFWHLYDQIQLSNIAVHPDFRRMGVAARVLKWLIQGIRGLGAAHIVLEVRPSNKAARKLYKKYGFQIEGIRKNYYSNPVEDALLMGLSIKG